MSSWEETMAEITDLGRFLLSCNVIDIEFKNGSKLDVYLALTPEQRQRGLSNLSSLDLDGMLFVYNQNSYVPYTMKDMKMDIEIAFFNSVGECVGAFEGKAGDTEPVFPGGPYRYVLEVPAGTFPFSDLKVREVG